MAPLSDLKNWMVLSVGTAGAGWRVGAVGAVEVEAAGWGEAVVGWGGAVGDGCRA